MKRIKGYYNSSNKGLESRLLQPLRVKPKRREKQSKEQLIKRDHLPTRIENPPYEIQGNLNQWLYSWGVQLTSILNDNIYSLNPLEQEDLFLPDLYYIRFYPLDQKVSTFEILVEQVLKLKNSLPPAPDFLPLNLKKLKKNWRYFNFYKSSWEKLRNSIDGLLMKYFDLGLSFFLFDNPFTNIYYSSTKKNYLDKYKEITGSKPLPFDIFELCLNIFYTLLEISLSLALSNNTRYGGINYAEKIRPYLLTLVDIYYQQILPNGIRLDELSLDNFFDMYYAILDVVNFNEELEEDKGFLDPLVSNFFNYYLNNQDMMRRELSKKEFDVANSFFNYALELNLFYFLNKEYDEELLPEKKPAIRKQNILNLVDIYYQQILPNGIQLNELSLDNFLDVFDSILEELSYIEESEQNKHFLEELASRFSNYYFSEFALASMALNIKIPIQISPQQYEQIKTNLTSAYALVQKGLEKAIELKKREKHKEFYGKIADLFISYSLDILSNYFSHFLNFNAVDIETVVSNYLFLIQALPEKKEEISTIIDRSLYFEIQRLSAYNTQLNQEFKPDFYNAVLVYARKTKNTFDRLREYCIKNNESNELSNIVKGGIIGLTQQYIQIAGLGIVYNLIEVDDVVQYFKSIIDEPFFNTDMKFNNAFNELIAKSTTYFAQLSARYPEPSSKFRQIFECITPQN